MLDALVQTQPVVLPDHLPAACFASAAIDYQVPALVLVALVKKESNGQAVLRQNANGSVDVGITQINTGSWLPYLKTEFGVTQQELLANNCLSIRSAAYVIRMEMRSSACAGKDFWCGVGRYHSPRDAQRALNYIADVWAIAIRLSETGKF
jgi:hypothetical protein